MEKENCLLAEKEKEKKGEEEKENTRDRSAPDWSDKNAIWDGDTAYTAYIYFAAMRLYGLMSKQFHSSKHTFLLKRFDFMFAFYKQFPRYDVHINNLRIANPVIRYNLDIIVNYPRSPVKYL